MLLCFVLYHDLSVSSKVMHIINPLILIQRTIFQANICTSDREHIDSFDLATCKGLILTSATYIINA